jgi:hypothetical protein
MRACSTGILTAFSQEGNIFSICFSTGEFLLGFMQVIITAVLHVAPFASCYPPDMWHMIEGQPSVCVLLLGQGGNGPPVTTLIS